MKEAQRDAARHSLQVLTDQTRNESLSENYLRVLTATAAADPCCSLS